MTGCSILLTCWLQGAFPDESSSAATCPAAAGGWSAAPASAPGPTCGVPPGRAAGSPPAPAEESPGAQREG